MVRALQELVLGTMVASASLFGLLLVPGGTLASIQHNPIWIKGNGDFTAANGVTGGNGTATDPYVIQGWDITSSSPAGIYIQNTNVHFVIRGTYLHDGYYGIYFLNVTNGRVEDSLFSDHSAGILLDQSRAVTIVRNAISIDS